MMNAPCTKLDSAAADLAARIIMESVTGATLRGVRCHVGVRESRVHITVTDVPPEAIDLNGDHAGAPTPRGAAIAERLAILAFLAGAAAGVERRASFVIPPATILRAANEARRMAGAQTRRAS